MEDLSEVETFTEGPFNSVEYTDRVQSSPTQFKEIVSALDGHYGQNFFPDAPELTLRVRMAESTRPTAVEGLGHSSGGRARRSTLPFASHPSVECAASLI